MSDSRDDREDKEEKLTQLLESAFDDFLKPVSSASTASFSGDHERGRSSAWTPNNEQDEDDDDDVDYASKMNTMIEDIMKKEPQLGKEWEKLIESCKKVSETENGDEAFEMLSETVKKLSESAQAIGEKGELNDDELAKLWNSLSKPGGLLPSESDALENDEAYSDFMPMVTNLMQNLLSREVLYPSIKDLSTKYPVWLHENRHKIDSDERVRYERQLFLMQEVCAELELEEDSDSRETRDQRFQKILSLMQAMKDCGSPPKDLVGDAPDLGADLDFSKLPNFDKMGEGGRNCCLM